MANNDFEYQAGRRAGAALRGRIEKGGDVTLRCHFVPNHGTRFSLEYMLNGRDDYDDVPGLGSKFFATFSSAECLRGLRDALPDVHVTSRQTTHHSP